MWCERLDAVTFPDPRIISFADQNLVSIKVHNQQGDGPSLVAKYNIQGYPTVMFLRPDGSEVDRIIGYAPPDEYLVAMERISAGDSTFESWRLRVAENPQDLRAQLLLAAAYKARYMVPEYVATGRDIVSLADFGSPAAAEGMFYIASGLASIDTIPDPLLVLLENDPESPFIHDILADLTQIYSLRRDTLNYVEAFEERISRAIDAGIITYSLLNSYAWRMTLFEMHLELALDRITLALELVEEDNLSDLANLLDTQAEVLWKLGRTTEAIEVIDRSIELVPEDEYYRQQKAKFEETLGGIQSENL